MITLRIGERRKIFHCIVVSPLILPFPITLFMSSTPSPDHPQRNRRHESIDDSEDTIDLRELFTRVWRGLPQILALLLIFATVGAGLALIASRIQPVDTTTRVIFSFPGFERGEYPDKSKFQPDDLRAPAVVAEALRRQSLDTSSEFQSKVRGALTIEGIIPDSIVKARDRLRASGQTPPPYVPDEYALTLSLPRSEKISDSQRNRLLNEIVSVYLENFNRTYAQTPASFGTAFETLRNADFPEYQLILDKEIESITGYLEQLLSRAGKDPQEAKMVERTSAFRSPTTNLSFKDLLEQAHLFAQIRLNETLGLIYQNGLSRDRNTALVKMDYYIRVLEHQERRALEDEGVVRGLLSQAQERNQNYVLGIKSQAASPRSESAVLDQGLIDSLLANDAYNFLIRQTLEVGRRVKQIQSEKARLVELRSNMQSFIDRDIGAQEEVLARVAASLKDLETAYQDLISKIRETHADFARQEFGDAIRLGSEIRTKGILKPLAIASMAGGALGFALGAGLSLLGVYVGRRQTA